MIADGEPWFVLADLCVVLGITNVGNVSVRLDQVNVRQAEVQNARGQMRRTVVVSEAGMYEVVIRSDKPEALRSACSRAVALHRRPCLDSHPHAPHIAAHPEFREDQRPAGVRVAVTGLGE